MDNSKSDNSKTLQLALVVFCIVYLLQNILSVYKSNFIINDGDNYRGLFLNFINNGYYNSVSQGTSVIYNLVLQLVYFFTKDATISFILVNSFSDLFYVFFGYHFIKKFSTAENKKWTTIIYLVYLLYILANKSYLTRSNEPFLGIFIILLLYFLCYKIFESKRNYSNFFFIGILFSLCISIRITSFLAIPLIVLSFYFWYKTNSISYKDKVVHITIALITSLFLTIIIHYPSIKEKGRLSFENKNPKDVNWTQRNYLGLKKIDDGVEKLHRDAIWKNTKFDEVRSYIKQNGKESLPQSLREVITLNPTLFLKMSCLNTLTSFARFFRFWGFLFFIPLFLLLRKKRFEFQNLPFIMFLAFLISISTVCFTFIEFRWFFGYEILIPVSIIVSINELSKIKSVKFINTVFIISLITITVFNLKTIYSLL